MARLPILSRGPVCWRCLQKSAADDITQSIFPFHRQLRGKKKVAKKPTTINVKLLKDIPGYGRKGSITPVEPGRMRNTWYPRQKAQYMTASMLEGVKPKEVKAERDFTFGVNPKVEETPKPDKKEKKDHPVEVQTKLLPPQRASELMEAALPSHILFYRTPIPEPEPPPPQEPPIRRRAASSAAADLDLASDPLPKPPKAQVTTIFGSVSTADIAESIKEVLAQTAEGARVVLGPEDVTILQLESNYQDNGIEGDRLKALGDFQVEARVKGGEPVVRIVTVRPQEAVSE